MASPLSFRFRIDEAHTETAIAALRMRAAERVVLLHAGIERLRELEGLTAARVAAFPGVGPAPAIALVRAIRWRCLNALPSWPLIRHTPGERLPAPFDRLSGVNDSLPGQRPTHPAPTARTTLADIIRLGPETVARRTGTPVIQIDSLFDQFAAIAELEPDLLRRVSASPDPFLLPAIDPVIIIAAARAQSHEERIAAFALGPSIRDSTLLLLRWGFGGSTRPTHAELAARFGLTSERVRQIVETRERAIAASGLRLDSRAEQQRA